MIDRDHISARQLSHEPATAWALRPRILLLTDRVPSSDSGHGIRVANVIEGLGAVGDLHVCLIDSSVGGDSLAPDADYASSVVRAENPKLWQKLILVLVDAVGQPYAEPRRVRADLARQVGHQGWDLVWSCRVRSYRISKGIVSGPSVVDFDDLTDRLLLSEIADRRNRRGRTVTLPRSLVDRLDARRWRRLQRRIASEVAKVVVCNEDDARYLRTSNAAVVPNGYPQPPSRRPSVKYDVPTLLFVGPLSYEPNRLAVDWLAFEVLPIIRRELPHARLFVVGYHHGVTERLRRAEGVTLLGYVHDLDPYFAASSVAVTPLHSGGGTRLKVIEALARQLPLVSTSFGCAGLGVTDGSELLIADGPEEFAQACLRLIRSPELSEQLADAGYAKYREALTSAASSAAVAQVAAEVLGIHRSGRTVDRSGFGVGL